MVPFSMGRKRSRKRRRRPLIWGGGFLAILVVVGGLGLDPLAAALLKRRAQDALGLAVDVEGVSVGLFRSQSIVHGLRIHNPDGFSKTPFFELKRLDLPMSLWGLAQRPLELEAVRAQGVVLTYEQTPAGSNVGRVLQILEERRAMRGEGRRYRIQRLDLEHIEFQARFEPWPNDRPLARVGVATLGLSEVGTDTSAGILLGEIAGILVRAVLGTAMRRGALELPGEVWGVIESPLKSLLKAPSRSVRIIEGLDAPGLGTVLEQIGDVLGGRK